MDILKIPRFLKMKSFWFLVGIMMMAVIGQNYTPLQLLIIPGALAMLALISTVVIIASSSSFIEKFVRLHKWRNRNNGSYSYSTIEVKTPSIWKFTLRTTWYSLAIIYNILAWTGGLDAMLNNLNKTPAMIGVFMPALFAALIINASTYLLTKSGLMFEDKRDGSKINLGREMTAKLDWAISPVLLLSLIYVIVTKLQAMLFVLTMMSDLAVFCFYAAFVGFYLLKKIQTKSINN